ncbi:TonB-dependent receptor [Membranihabitans marinus]|uniref:hypothetical protein n=1 Tax=Membranihabitans marinus TaxID=1227546 RepID=UPI001F21643D|nr:hypothetical protein [Membranihabitans marinus]
MEKEEKISQSQRFNLGYNNNLVSGWEGNVEAFYQSFTNLSYYSIIDNSDQYYSLEASGGEGYNYGMELSLSKAWRNKSNLQLGYTWIKSERQYENINNGNSFRADYGREHELKIQFIFPYKKLLIGSQWTMASGFPFTIPNAVVHSNLLRNYNYISGKNNFSLPLYHRLDLSISRTLESKKGRKSIFSFNLFNAYNRFNADHIIPDFPSKKIKKISNFGVVPSFYYKLYIK